MAAIKCVVLEHSFINNRLHEPGEVVDYDPGPDGKIGRNLQSMEEQPEQSGGEGGAVVGYTAKFNGGTRWRVVDAAGAWFSDFIGASKEEAQAEADRLNAGGQPFVKSAEQSGGEGGNTDDDGHPDA
ncbi:hypothetical protein EXN22_16210 [Pseudomonas tructae]|uniref:Uncharacterized protein n=1 Tax=Pseudomonas tructae TaxID=2518644 RepID=A0A411MK66_9PSED|nr:hypothetical protein [Pseudomonas tructae]QBF27158.1 hypothetical protein EXN22_16210 [Pseudomonas tructae]